MQEDAKLLTNGSDYSESVQTTQLQRYLNFLRRRWWIPVLTMVISAGVCLWYIRQQPPRYRAVGTLWMQGKLRLPESSLYAEEMQMFFGTQIELLQSRRLQELAHERIVSQKPNLNKKRPRVKVHITTLPKTAILELAATGTNQAYTTAYLNSLMTVYLENRKRLRDQTSDDAEASLKEKLQKTTKEFNDLQQQQIEFVRQNDVVDLQQSAELGAYVTKLKLTLADLQVQRDLLDAVSTNQIFDPEQKSGPLPLPVSPGSTDSPLSASTGAGGFLSAKGKIEELKLQLKDFENYMKPGHPKIIKLKEDIKHSEDLIGVYQRFNQTALDERKRALESEIGIYTNQIAAWQLKSHEASKKLIQLEQIKMAIERTKSSYDQLLRTVEMVSVSKDTDQDLIGVMEPAANALATSQAPMILAGALLAGLGLGLGIIFLQERLDDRFTSVVELMEHFDEEIVGQVPQISNGRSNKQLELLKPDDDRHMLAESNRSLRSSLLYMTSEGARPKTILVASAIPNEGKSTIAANLARTLAFAGSRVLLVDGDLRCGHLHKLLGLSREPGMTELLRQEVSLEKVIVATPLPSLSFIPCGSLAHNAGELFLGSVTDIFLKQVAKNFDYVIFDSAPIFAADDTTTLAPKLDGVLFVVRGSFTRARLARQALEMLYQRRVNVLGLIFNGANAASREYYFYKYGEYHRKPAAV